jgi:hypothetical protein
VVVGEDLLRFETGEANLVLISVHTGLLIRSGK